MSAYCLKCKKNTESIDPKVSATSNGKTMTLSKCAICGSKKSKFIKKQEVKGLLSNLGIRAPLSKVPLLGDVNLCLKCIPDNLGLLVVLGDHLLILRKV